MISQIENYVLYGSHKEKPWVGLLFTKVLKLVGSARFSIGVKLTHLGLSLKAFPFRLYIVESEWTLVTEDNFVFPIIFYNLRTSLNGYYPLENA